MDNNLLKQLIAQHKRVVIPEFGAFLKKEVPGGEELVFSPFLRKDDGVVTDAIVREYGVETEDARAMVAEFVIYLRHSLASSGRYHIEGVGLLAADTNGTVTLKEEEPQVVVPEPVLPVQQQPIQAQAVYVQPQVPQQRMQTPVPSQPAVTRPQSIQVQSPVPPMPQQSPMPRQQFPFQQPMPQQPVAQPMQPPVQGGGMPMSQMQQSYPGQQRPMQQPQTQPHQPQRSVQPSMAGQIPSGGMPPRGQQGQGVPQAPQGMGRNAMGMPQQQHQQQQSNNPMGGGVPGQPGAGQNGGRRPGPPRRNRPPKTKADVWLIVAIMAALVVIAIMVYGFLNSDPNEIDLGAIDAMVPVADTVSTELPAGM